MKRILIMASGPSTRWENHLGVPKHLAPISGEPLIHRLQRQFRGQNELVLSATDLRYPLNPVVVGIPDDTGTTRLPNTAIGQSEKFWNRDDATVIVFGDVVFTDEAVRTITEFKSSHITFFGRSTGLQGGKPYQELFAILIPLAKQNRMRKAMNYVREHRDCDTVGGWLVYRWLNKIPINKHRIARHFVEIADGTDDIDYPPDYEWVKDL